MTSFQTGRFDPMICLSDETRTIYKKVCQNSSNSDKCVRDMQHFCNTEIHTNKEFNLQTDVLSCVSQCGADKKCMLQCAQR